MAQSALTVTPPSPTPPTNMSCTGATPPNVPNYTKLTYANYNGGGAMPAYVTNPPPYFDDGTAGALHTFAANTAALASGTGATSGGITPSGSTCSRASGMAVSRRISSRLNRLLVSTAAAVAARRMAQR